MAGVDEEESDLYVTGVRNFKFLFLACRNNEVFLSNVCACILKLQPNVYFSRAIIFNLEAKCVVAANLAVNPSVYISPRVTNNCGVCNSCGISKLCRSFDCVNVLVVCQELNVKLHRVGRINVGIGIIGIRIIGSNAAATTVERSTLRTCSHPFILCTVVASFTLVHAHPCPSSFVAAPVVGEHSTGCLRKCLNNSYVFSFLNGSVSCYFINGLTINEPCDGVGLPTEAVCVEFLRSIKAEVIHIFIPALTVYEEVELYLCCILTKELNINLVVRIGFAVLKVIRTCANKECACSTGVCRRLHANLVITVVIVVLCTRFTCSVAVGNFYAVNPHGCRLLNDTKTHNAVFVINVVVLPYYVKYVAIGPTVRGVQYACIGCTLCEISNLFCLERCIGKLYLVAKPLIKNIRDCTATECHCAHNHECDYC